ncbi:hypothetical protein ACYATM_00110 [Lactobacillaceae bacterium Scapto_B20]
MTNSKVISILFLVFYAFLLYFAFDVNDMAAQMIAMKMMGIGMFAEAVLGTIHAFKHHK